MAYIEIRHIDENTDLSSISCLDWDLVINGRDWNVYRVDDHCHVIGGRYGDNDYWCCPADEIPTYQNLIGFDGEAPEWGIQWVGTNYIKHKHSSRIEKNGKWIITRNGKLFYEDGARDPEYGLACAQKALVQFHEHFINFHSRNWRKEMMNRKIFYYEEPAIITGIIDDQGCVIVEPDRDIITVFKPHCWQLEDLNEFDEGYYGEYKDSSKTNYLDPHIYWSRDDETTEIWIARFGRRIKK